ncbi:unnamed protein product [Moneuplotes crassus]|uniref:Uncharacterized protein n=2 Tax=Euplotes crassus TaxID=5936 RepID=A0AAD1XJN4_EUPCR|nr:unnamed protein product [Moneuplotes crassus]
MESNKINSVSFNQDHSCYCISTDNGVEVHTINPDDRPSKIPLDGSIMKASMLYRTNIVAMVGGGTNPKYSSNKLILWDDKEKEVAGELTFGFRIRNFAIRRDIIAVQFEDKVMVFGLRDLELLKTHKTSMNYYNILCLNTKTSLPIIAMLGSKRGTIKIHFHQNNTETEIECHQAEIRAASLNPEGTLLATASTKGTLIRVFNTKDGGEPLRELRRGSENADIQCLAFSSLSIYLSCTSDKGTAHVFTIWGDDGISSDLDKSRMDPAEEEITSHRHSFLTRTDKDLQKNKHSMFKFIKKIIPFFSSEWSFKQVRLGGRKNQLTICGFEKEEALILVNIQDAEKGTDEFKFRRIPLED